MNCENFDTYRCSNIFEENFNFSEYFALNFLELNSFDYRKGLMLIIDVNILEIKEILSEQNKYFLICGVYKLVEFNTDLNSIEISETEEYKLVCLDKNLPKPYEKKELRDKTFIIAETLDVYNGYWLIWLAQTNCSTVVEKI